MVSRSSELSWASHPNFDQCRGRFLGYAGFPMILTIPCLFLSAAAACRVHQLNRTIQRIQRSRYSFTKSTARVHSRSQLSNERTVPSERAVSPVISPSGTTPASVDPEMLYSSQPTSGRADVRGGALHDNPDVSPATTFGALSTSHRRSETWEVLGSIEDGDELDSRRQMGDMMLSCKLASVESSMVQGSAMTLAISDEACCVTPEA